MATDRRSFLTTAAALTAKRVWARPSGQRVVVIMCDGFGLEYMDATPMPVLQRWRKSGIFRRVQATVPTVTNTNNASICCGVWPEEHGITGNSYLDERTAQEQYMETADLLLAPTLFERAARQGVKSALLSSKKKTIGLLGRGADLKLTAEAPDTECVQRLGSAPSIYSPDINYWLWKAAIDVLKSKREFGCLYVHTTDYPMHMWPPEAKESQEHLQRLDALLGEAEAAAPDAMFLLTADHGMNHKRVCWDLARACAARGTPVRIAIAVEKDKYPKHHRGHGGISYIYLRSPRDTDRVGKTLQELSGVEKVLTRTEAARRYRLMPSRIGDLIVQGDRDTVFGELETEKEELPAEYRTHGSMYESHVPLVLHNAPAAIQRFDFRNNRDLARWSYT